MKEIGGLEGTKACLMLSFDRVFLRRAVLDLEKLGLKRSRMRKVCLRHEKVVSLLQKLLLFRMLDVTSKIKQ